MTGLPRPPLDPEVEVGMREFKALYPAERPLRTADDIADARLGWPPTNVESVLRGRRVRHEVHSVPGHDDSPIDVSVFRPATQGPLPVAGIYLIHGGGMVSGHRHHSADTAVRLVEEHQVVVVTVEYRLAPEFPDPIPVEDCYAALTWFAAQARQFQVDPTRLAVMGASAGGGLAAGVALMARDRSGPLLAAQVLICPMLDDRNDSVSARQFEDTGWWDRGENNVGWTALLGERRGTDAASPYAAPARATDLSGLPPTFVDVGSAEVFRDECIAFTSAIWAAGGAAELHVWAGGTHGFDALFPEASVARSAVQARDDWIRRVLTRRRAGA